MKDPRDQLRNALFEIAMYGSAQGCHEYGIYLNRGENDVVYVPNSKRPLHIMCDLYSHVVNTKSPLVEKTLNIKPESINKVYYHIMQGDLGIMVIGILTSKEKQDMIIEHVV